MKKFIIGLLFLSFFCILSSFAQKRVLIGAGFDGYKTDNYGLFEKFQFGAEFNYFIIKQVALGGGIEAWSAPRTTFIVIGTRIYPIKPLFIRFRGLLARNSEIALGAGYSLPLAKILRAEFTGDYYFDSKELGLRGGLALAF